MSRLRQWAQCFVLCELLLRACAAPSILQATVDVRRWERTSMFYDEPHIYLATWTIKFSEAIALRRRSETPQSPTSEVCDGTDACPLPNFQKPDQSTNPFDLPPITEAGFEGISVRIQCGNLTLETGERSQAGLRDPCASNSRFCNPCSRDPSQCDPCSSNPAGCSPTPCPLEMCDTSTSTRSSSPIGLGSLGYSSSPIELGSFGDSASIEGSGSSSSSASSDYVFSSSSFSVENTQAESEYTFSSPSSWPSSRTPDSWPSSGSGPQGCYCPQDLLGSFGVGYSLFGLSGSGYSFRDDLNFWERHLGRAHGPWNSLGSGSGSGSLGDIPDPDQLFVLPPVPNAVARFVQLQNMSLGQRTYALFAEETYADDTLVLGSVVGLEFPGSEAEGEVVVDLAQCEVHVDPQGDGFAWDVTATEEADREEVVDSAAVAELATECSVASLDLSLAMFEYVLQKLSVASTEEAFSKGISSLGIVKLSDGYAGCEALLLSMTDLSWQTTNIPGSRACVAPWNSTEWEEDACCNRAKAFEECCAPRDVAAPKLVASAAPQLNPQCAADAESEATVINAVRAFAELLNEVGECKAVRAHVSPESVQQLLSFWDVCQDALTQGTTKAGAETCAHDTECWTGRCEEERCVPSRGFEWAEHFTQCAVHNMEPLLLNAFRKQVGAKEGDSEAEVAAALTRKLAVEDCYSGGVAGAAGGRCMIAASEAECSLNLFAARSLLLNVSASRDQCAALGADYRWSEAPVVDWEACEARDMGPDMGPAMRRNHEGGWYGYFEYGWYGYYYDGGVGCNLTRPLGCVNIGSQCREVETAADTEQCYYYYEFDWETQSYDYESGYWECFDDGGWWWDYYYSYSDFSYYGYGDLHLDCEEVYTDWLLSDMQLLYQAQRQTYVSGDLFGASTKWHPTSPVAPQCQVLSPYYWTVDHSDRECDADCQCDQMRDVLAFVNAWDIPANTSAYLQLGNVYEYRFDYVVNEIVEELVARGTKEFCEWEKACNWRPDDESLTAEDCTAEDAGFCCADDEGGLCWDVKTQRQACVLNDVPSEQVCVRRGGVWDVTRDWWEACTLPDSAANASDCWDTTLCPVEYWQGWGWEAGFCEETDVCYVNEVDNEAACLDLQDKAGTGWPQWYSPRNESDGYYEYYWWWDSQEFYPLVGLCVQGYRGWYGADGSATREECLASGNNTFVAARSFREGRWDSPETCRECSNAPWDYALAQDEGECARVGGLCSRYCEACEASYYGLESACLATSATQDECEAQQMTWLAELQVCVGGTRRRAQCEDRADARIIRCRDLAPSNCSYEALRTNAWYNGSFESLLDCRVTDWAECGGQEECEASGSCDDWELSWSSSWWGWYDDEGGPVCLVPFTTADEWGWPLSPACEAAAYNGFSISYEQRLGCVVYGANASYCASLGGRTEGRARSEEECHSRTGCFDTDNDFVTAIPQSECSAAEGCEEGRFEWRSAHSWTPGVWTASSVQPLSWKERAAVPKNVWVESVRVEDLWRALLESLYSVVGEAYLSEALCKLRPTLDLLRTVACDCATDAAAAVSSGECQAGLGSAPPVSVVAIRTLWTNIPVQFVQAGAGGSVRVPRSTVAASVVDTDNVEVELGIINGFGLRAQAAGRRKEGLDDKLACGDFEIVPNQDGEIVGQIVGNGVRLRGLSGGTVTFCIPRSSTYPACIAKYPYLDFANGTDNRPGTPLGVPVKEDTSSRFCGEVPLSMAETTIFPILRTRDMKPWVAFKGRVVRRALALDIASTELFTVSKQAAFKASIADALKAQGGGDAVSADSIVIEKVCDAKGCVDMLASRRADGDGITVTYQVQATEGIDVDAVANALDDSSFVETFAAEMESNGVLVTAQVAAVDDPTTSSTPSPPTTSSPPTTPPQPPATTPPPRATTPPPPETPPPTTAPSEDIVIETPSPASRAEASWLGLVCWAAAGLLRSVLSRP